MSRKTGIATLVAAATFAAAGCGGDEEDEGGGTAAVSDDGKVLIADFRYEPETIVVETGQPAVFLNSDVAPHTATAIDEESFDTGRLEIEDEGELTFGEPGTYQYFCDFHPFMKGVIEVVEG